MPSGYASSARSLADVGPVSNRYTLVWQAGETAFWLFQFADTKWVISASMSYRSYYNRTLLSCAAENGNEVIIKRLLKTDQFDVNLRDAYGWTPLHYAASSGHEAVVKLLLEKDRVKVRSTGLYCKTPLYHATINGHEAVVKILLETNQVDDSLTNHEDQILWCAAESGNKAAVNLLRGTDQIKVKSMDKCDSILLFSAAQSGCSADAKLFGGKALATLLDKFRPRL